MEPLATRMGAAGAHHGALGHQVVKVDGLVQGFRCQTAAGRAAGLDSLELLALGGTAADVVDQLPEGGAHGDLHQTDVIDLAAQGKDLGALALLGAAGGELRSALAQDVGNTGQSLDVVDDGGFRPRPPFTAGKGGRGRGIPRLPSMEFSRAVSSPQTKAPAPRRM